MTQKQTLKAINEKIDKLIIDGKTSSSEYQRLTKLHLKIRGVIKK